MIVWVTSMTWATNIVHEMYEYGVWNVGMIQIMLQNTNPSIPSLWKSMIVLEPLDTHKQLPNRECSQQAHLKIIDIVLFVLFIQQLNKKFHRFFSYFMYYAFQNIIGLYIILNITILQVCSVLYITYQFFLMFVFLTGLASFTPHCKDPKNVSKLRQSKINGLLHAKSRQEHNSWTCRCTGIPVFGRKISCIFLRNLAISYLESQLTHSTRGV